MNKASIPNFPKPIKSNVSPGIIIILIVLIGVTVWAIWKFAIKKNPGDSCNLPGVNEALKTQLDEDASDCIVTECISGWSPSNDKKSCNPNDGTDCIITPNPEFSTSTSYVNQICKVTGCELGYNINEDGTGCTEIPQDGTACELTPAPANSLSYSIKNGKCVVDQCEIEYEVNSLGNGCNKITPAEGLQCNPPEENKIEGGLTYKYNSQFVCSPDTCVRNHTLENNTCVLNLGGICENDDILESEKVERGSQYIINEDGKCELSQCQAGFKLSDDSLSCVPRTGEECTPSGTPDVNAETYTWDNNGQCLVNCKPQWMKARGENKCIENTYTIVRDLEGDFASEKDMFGFTYIPGKIPKDVSNLSNEYLIPISLQEGRYKDNTVGVYKQGGNGLTRISGSDKDNVLNFCKDACINQNSSCSGIYINGESEHKTNCPYNPYIEAFGGTPTCDDAKGETKPGDYDCYLLSNGFETDGLEEIAPVLKNKFNLNSGPNEGTWARTELSFTPEGESPSWPILTWATYKMDGAGEIDRCTNMDLKFKNSKGQTISNPCPSFAANEEEYGAQCSIVSNTCEVKNIPKTVGTENYPKSCCLKSTVETI